MRGFVVKRVEAQQAENRELEAALRPLRRETAEVDLRRNLLADLLGRHQVLKVLSEDSPPAAEAFAELSRLPRDIALTHAEVKGMQLIVAGVARSDAAVRQMVEQLRATRFIANARIAQASAAPAHDPFGSAAQMFRLEADLRH